MQYCNSQVFLVIMCSSLLASKASRQMVPMIPEFPSVMLFAWAGVAILIERFGGTQGIRDTGLLESALQRPHQTFEEIELYPTSIDKAAAILESVVKNHPFIDGNKRTGYALARLTLMADQMDIEADQEQKYKFIIQISEGEPDFDEIKAWLLKYTGSAINKHSEYLQFTECKLFLYLRFY